MDQRTRDTIERACGRAAAAAGGFWLAPGAIAGLALLLRLHDLAGKPFWLDEIASLRRATMPFSDVAAAALHNNHYPTYFLLLWLVAKAGASPWVLRLPSAVFGAIGAGLVCAVGREAEGRQTGIAAGLLLALSPFDVQYGQEARSYTLVTMLILVAMWGLVRLARDPATAARPLRFDWRPPAPWLAYCAGTAAALDVLNVAAGWLVAANLAALVMACRAGDGRRAFLRNWGIAQALVVAAWLPALVAVWVVSDGAVWDAAQWAPPATMASIWAVAAPVYLHRIGAFITFDLLPARVPGLSAAIAALAACGVWRLRRQPAVAAAVGCAGIVLPILFMLLSLAKPIMVPRYFGWSAPAFFILAGAGLGRLSAARFAACAAALAAACLINLSPYYHAETKPRWDVAVDRLADAAHDGDVVLLNGWYADYVMQAFAERGPLADRQLVIV
ncbi:MAG TPA: glycosyltransferase family 39 protein, partial [Stellaceae bacterium]|nr:glycosyltransferase family 39 protein [Stellaceae bacterium]